MLTIVYLKCIDLKTYVVSRNADFELDQYPASKVIDVSHSQIESRHPIYSNEMHFSGNPLSAYPTVVKKLSNKYYQEINT